MKSMNQNFSPQPQVNAVGVAGAVISGVGLVIFLCVWVLASTISSESNDFIGRAFTEIGGGFIVIGAGTVGALLSIVGIIVSAIGLIHRPRGSAKIGLALGVLQVVFIALLYVL